MDRGTLFSGVGHVGLVLWVVLGDWLFTFDKAPEVAVTEVSMMTAAEFDAMQAAAPSTPAPSEQPAEIATPDPVTPEPDPAPAPEAAPEPAPAPEALPEPEPLPEPDPVAEDQPEPVPDPIAPPAAVEQPLASLNTSVRPKPRPADRVAPTPVDTPEPEAVTSEDPTPAVSDAPAEVPQVVEEAKPEAVAEEAGDVLRTEATEDQTEALGMTASPRPKSRPARRPVETPAETPTETATADTSTADSDADAIAAAVAEAAAEATADPVETGGAPNAPAGPPMTFGETDALRVAVQGCWALGSVSSEAMRTTVIVRVDMDQSGRPVVDSIRMTGTEGGSDASAKVMFAAAKRAIIRCTKQGYPLPAEKYETWKDLELVFDPSGMVSR